jgi:hypothetical protein
MKESAPAGLAAGGAGLWSRVVELYDLRPDEMVTLEDVCRVSDMIDALDSAWAEQGRPLTTKGSMGQLVTHPLISEIRTHRMARNTLWRQLRLPDADGESRPNQQRDAANSRWAAAHGKSA